MDANTISNEVFEKFGVKITVREDLANKAGKAKKANAHLPKVLEASRIIKKLNIK